MSYHLSHCTRSEMLLQQHLVLWQAQQTTVVALQLPSALLLYLNSIKTSWTAPCSCTGFLLLKFRYWASFTMPALTLNEREQRCTSPGSALLGRLRVLQGRGNVLALFLTEGWSTHLPQGSACPVPWSSWASISSHVRWLIPHHFAAFCSC